MEGNSTAAIAEFDTAIQSMGRGGWILGPMGYALAQAGRKAEAENIAREIEVADGPGVQLAHVYAALGDKPRVLDALCRVRYGYPVNGPRRGDSGPHGLRAGPGRKEGGSREYRQGNRGGRWPRRY